MLDLSHVQILVKISVLVVQLNKLNILMKTAQVIDCYFQRQEKKDESKGLVELCKDLDIQLPDKAKLKEMHEILSTHRAFQNVIKLEMLAVKYSLELLAPYLPNPSPSSS
ncbi:unnamed protein product [Didymodactylos carnosus]|uniref:Uncharacterized protein n=1 Tax=Didymodactylos carnosus TaxID=1234261 RepID=A0A814YL48_9BILA|nr:unnamed protein product [Didymodactylos carnosus]CAF3994152.1 unnamed protein product [Didymodactylos carnosus]